VERETTFRLGGALVIGLSLAFAGALVWAGAGVDYASAYLGIAFGVVLGSFFVYVGGAEARERHALLERAADGTVDETTRPP
jgi:hypothetical protein